MPTICEGPLSSLDDLGAAYPLGASLDEKYQASLLLMEELHQAVCSRNVAAWERFLRAETN